MAAKKKKSTKKAKKGALPKETIESSTEEVIETSTKKEVKESKIKADLKITSKSDKPHYYEINPKGDSCVVLVDVPNKVGKTVRLRKMKECDVTIKFVSKTQVDFKMPSLLEARLVDLVKSGNSWSVVARPLK